MLTKTHEILIKEVSSTFLQQTHVYCAEINQLYTERLQESGHNSVQRTGSDAELKSQDTR